MPNQNTMEKIVSLAKRRGFIFPSSEIYGGFASCYDYGPLGVEFKNNIKRAWWKEMVQTREDIVGLDAAILMNPKVWQASGHLSAGFADPLVECRKCHHRFRLDHLTQQEKNVGLPLEMIKCPNCGGSLTGEKKFNLMMKTFVGPVEDEASVSYLRGETCQGIYVNFQNVLNSSRQKIPFGIAQIGKAFRNEITPGNFIFRTREFEQMEMQWFCQPLVGKNPPKNAEDDAEKRRKNWEPKEWFDYWKEERMNWYLTLGLKKDKLKFKPHAKGELPHYAKAAVDIQYQFPFGWDEFEGIHDRGDWDLSNHTKHSGQDLSYFDPATGSGQTKEKFIPNIIETSAGADRAALVFLVDAYEEIKGGRTETTESTKEEEVVLRLHKDLAPIKAAVLPLSKKPPLIKLAKSISKDLSEKWSVQYDEVASIGRRYRRQDEIGTPYCVTVDFESLEDKKVTVRDRDTMRQDRIAIVDLVDYLGGKLA